TNSAMARLAAAEVINLAALSSDQLVRFISAVSGDSLISPHAVLGAARRAGLSNESADALLAYLQQGLGFGWQLSQEELAWLHSAVPPSCKPRLAQLELTIDENLARQRRELAELAPLLQGGDPHHGQKLFREKAACAACHRVGKEGGQIGPDLTKIGAIRSGRDLLESIVMPSATFAQGYETYRVTLKSGDQRTGIRVRQFDDSIVLREASGAEMRLHPNQIQSIESMNISIMPEGLLSGLTREEIRDLLAYLQSTD